MPLPLADVRRRFEDARREAAGRLAEDATALAAAPAWYRAGLDPAALPQPEARLARSLGELVDAVELRRARLDRIDAELRRLDLDARELAEVEAVAVAWFNGLRSGAQLLEELAPHPANEELRPRGAIDTRLAAALVRFRRTLPGRQIAHL